MISLRYLLNNNPKYMSRYLIILLIFIGAASFAANVDYSKLNPVKIEQDLANCPNKSPRVKLSCAELKTFAERINDLAIQLQVDRQGYGKAILASQEKLAKQQELLVKNKDNRQLSQEIAANQQEINERLLLIKWLESPR